MKNIIKTKEFNIPLEIDKMLVVENKVDLTNIFIIYAGGSAKELYESVVGTAQDSNVNIIAFGSQDTLVAGPSIDSTLCILKEKVMTS